jgi:hypothetical protein
LHSIALHVFLANEGRFIRANVKTAFLQAMTGTMTAAAATALLALASLHPTPAAAAVESRAGYYGCYQPAAGFLKFGVEGFVHMNTPAGLALSRLKNDSLNGCEVLAKQGDRRSQSYMGLIALTPDDAFHWIRKAAEQGDLPSIERMHTFAPSSADKLKWALIYRARIKDWPRIKMADEPPVSSMQKRWADDAVAAEKRRLSPGEVARVESEVRRWLRRHPARP